MSQNEKVTTPGTTRNKDIALLSRVLYTMQDVCITEQKRLWMQDRLYSITAKLTGMPSGHGGTGGLEKCFAEIGEIEEKYKVECAEYLDELKRAEDILNSIQSRTMRTIVTMRYVMAIPNTEIMERLNLKRRRFEAMCRCIEEAEDMRSVRWSDRFGDC